MNRGWTFRVAAPLLALGLVGGCAMSDDKAASLLVAPGDYDLYSCPQLAQAAAQLRKRQLELEGVMAKADTDTGGRMMSTIGYRPEYLKIRGEQHEMQRTAREKQCDLSAASATQDAPAALPPPAKPPRHAR
jgi:hypothetical protein